MMTGIDGTGRSAGPEGRRERGIKAYARIFDVPEKDVPAAIGQARGSLAMEAIQRVAGARQIENEVTS
jgi:hypothetical protein